MYKCIYIYIYIHIYIYKDVHILAKYSYMVNIYICCIYIYIRQLLTALLCMHTVLRTKYIAAAVLWQQLVINHSTADIITITNSI